MKTKNLILICLLCVVAFFCILIGTGTVKWSLYKSEFSDSTYSKWNNSSSVFRLNNSKDKMLTSSVSFIVVYKSKIVGDLHSPNPIKIDISNKDFGSLRSPLFKSSDYKFTVNCKKIIDTETESAVGRLVIDGKIYVSGHYKIVGFCSSETARNLILDKVMNDIYTNVKKNIQ
jgi:hypothetical protein